MSAFDDGVHDCNCMGAARVERAEPAKGGAS